MVLRYRVPGLDASPSPPFPDATVDLLSRHAITNEAEGNVKLRLDVAIPRLVIEKEHIFVWNPTGLVDAGKVLGLVRREDLDVIEIVQGAHRARVRRRVIREGRDDVESLEHIAGQVGGMRARGDAKGNIARAAGVEDGRNGGIEGE